jgi:hypothetical protein
LLGALAMGAAFVANYAYLRRKETAGAEKQSELLRETLRWIAIASILLLGVELFVLPLYLVTLAGSSAAGLATVRLMAGSYGWVLALRVLLAFIGAGVFAAFLYQNAMSKGQEKVLASLAYSTFVIVLVAEVLGRTLFYATHVGIGI